MCDQEPPQGLLPAGLPRAPDGEAPCIKCKARPATIAVRQSEYCDECFSHGIYQKYRYSVFASRGKKGPDTPRTLLAVSTGAASRLLVYLSQLGRLSFPNRRDLGAFVPVHIVEGDAEDTADLRALLEELGLLAAYREVPLHRIMSAGLAEAGADDRARLEALMRACPSDSRRHDLRRILRLVLLAHLAGDLGCSRLHLGDTSDRMAVNAIADVCAGRGAAVPWAQLPLQACRSAEVVRPLRDVQALEVDAYLRLAGRAAAGRARAEPATTLYGLADAFLGGLAKDFSGTSSNVARTMAKVRTDLTPLAAEASCRLCWCPLVGDASECAACTDLLADLGTPDLPRYCAA